MKSLSLPSFSMFSNKSKTTTTRQTQDNGDGNDNEKSEGIVRRISRSLFPRMSGSRKKGDSVYETETSSPDLNIISSRSSYSINNNNTSTSGNEGPIKNALSGSFAVVGNFDSASSRIPGDRYPNDGYDDNNDADDKTILSRTSSMSSVKSTPMQLLTIRADQMLPNKIITDSTTLAVKEIAALESTTKSPVTTPSKQDNSSSIYVECDKIIDSIAQGWNDSLQAIPYDRLSKKSLIFSAKKKASVDLKTYMTRLVRIINKIYDGSMYDRQGSGVRCLLIATIYLEKIMKLNDDLELTDLNIHRLFLGAFMLALKMYEDELPPEASLAEYGGVSIQQLHSIESKFFELMRFNIFLQTDEYLNLFSKIRMLCQLDFSPEFPSWVGLENKSG